MKAANRTRVVEKNLNEHVEQESRAYREIVRKRLDDISPDEMAARRARAYDNRTEVARVARRNREHK